MQKVKIRKGDAVLSFNEAFYEKRFIEQAIEDFSEACEVKLDKDKIILKPKDINDLKIIGYEFYNYVLGLIQNAG